MKRILASALASGALLLAPAAAAADTSFGADPAQGINTGLTCAIGAPTGFEIAPIFFGTQGSPSCMWTWNNPAVGSDLVPFPVTGGSGTITSVTLPAMPAPGPMAVVVLTAALNSSGDPAHPQSICCQVKQVGPVFTVPANQVATVPQSLHVSATETADLSIPGDTAFGDLVGVAVLAPNASLPVRFTGATGIPNFDGAYAYYPAPAGANGEYSTPYDPAGFQLLARFTLAPDGAAPAPAPAPAPATAPTPGPAAGGGLRLGKGARVGADGRTATLGKATNPPTATTSQTLTLPAAARASAAKPKKPVVLGRGRTRIPAGKSAALTVKLNRKGRARLRARGKLVATLTVVAANARGETQTVRRKVTIELAARKRR
ncbi:MAG: hypothetical protein AB7V58_11160 [Solirubrobacterales bacterium]